MRNIVFGVLILALILVITGCSQKPNLNDEELKEIVKAQLVGYCDNLDEGNYMLNCPSCFGLESTEYTIKRENENYVVNAKLKIIFGRDTHDAYPIIEYVINSNGEVINNPEYPNYDNVCPPQ